MAIIKAGIYIQDPQKEQFNFDDLKTWAAKHGCDCSIYTERKQLIHDIEDASNPPGIVFCYNGETLQSVQKVLESYIQERKCGGRSYQVTVRREKQELMLDRIIYFESHKRMIYAYGDAEPISFYGKLSELEQHLSDQGFVRVHRSFLVNADYVDEIHRTHLVAAGIELPVGRDYYENKDDKGIWRKLNKWNNSGMVIGEQGRYDGVIFRIHPDVEIFFGSDMLYSDIIVEIKGVDRRHCALNFDRKRHSYLLENLSEHVIIVNKTRHIEPMQKLVLYRGDLFQIGEKEDVVQVFRLG